MIGGGLAGITASLALAKQGVQVQLLEARRQLGGRTGSFIDSQSQETIDYCQHVGMGCCTNLKMLIGWLGQRGYWDTHEQLHFYGPDGSYQLLAAWPLVPAPLHISSWLWRWPGLTLRDRVSVARGLLAVRRLKISSKTDGIEAQSWLQQHSQTDGAIARFWRTIAVSALGEELARVNLSALAKVIQDGFLKQRDAFHLLVPNRPLGELFGTMAEKVLRENGVDVQLGNRVQPLVALSNEKFAVDNKLLRTQNADAVVMAVPWFRVRDLIDSIDTPDFQQVNQNAQRLTASPISGVHSWWDRPWMDTPHAAIVGRLCQWVFPKVSPVSVDASQRYEHYYQIVISASRQLPRGDSSAVAQQIQADLAAVFPQAGKARLLRIQTVTEPNSVFSLTTEAARLRPRTRIGNSNVWLAGDWVQTGWPATMEGAIISGLQAADGILAS